MGRVISESFAASALKTLFSSLLCKSHNTSDSHTQVVECFAVSSPCSSDPNSVQIVFGFEIAYRDDLRTKYGFYGHIMGCCFVSEGDYVPVKTRGCDRSHISQQQRKRTKPFSPLGLSTPLCTLLIRLPDATALCYAVYGNALLAAYI